MEMECEKLTMHDYLRFSQPILPNCIQCPVTLPNADSGNVLPSSRGSQEQAVVETAFKLVVAEILQLSFRGKCSK